VSSPPVQETGLDVAVEEAVRSLRALLLEAVSAVRPAGPGDEPWRLLSLPEAAGRLGRSERWLRERVRRGDIAVVRLDGKLAFELADLTAFANAHRLEAS
jgi:hypothetical protein